MTEEQHRYGVVTMRKGHASQEAYAPNQQPLFRRQPPGEHKLVVHRAEL